MSIKNKDQYVANLWDWGFLDGCFGNTKIRVTDLDGLVERNGHFLFIEAKSSGVGVPRGQQILFDRLIESGRNTVLVVWGEPNRPEMARLWGGTEFGTDEAGVQAIVRDWFQYASKEAQWTP